MSIEFLEINYELSDKNENNNDFFLPHPIKVEKKKITLNLLLDLFKNKIKNLKNLTFKVNALIIDGTCACGKSTLCNKLNKTTGAIIYKNKDKLIQRDTNSATTLGYIYKSFFDINNIKGKCILDRSPLNVLDWAQIWIALSKYKHESFNDIYLFGKDYFYDAPTILLIDSDILAVHERLKNRNTGEDIIRSDWDHYIYIQNNFYKKKGEDKHTFLIDLNDYEGTLEEKHNIIELFANYLFNIVLNVEPFNFSEINYPEINFTNNDFNKNVVSYETNKRYKFISIQKDNK